MVVLSDVFENILTRLDVKDLLRCKSVCKSWYSLISNPYFVKAHSKHNDVGHTRIAMPKYRKIPNHENSYQYNEWMLIGSSNGLVCVSIFPLLEYEALILLINPLTREVRELPMTSLHPQEIRDDHIICLSFGYDSSTDDYKLVMGISEEGVDGSIFQVFSLKSMTWKLIGHINYGLLLDEKPGVLFNGALHWFAHDYNTKDRRLVILSFDLSREEFKVIPVPDDSEYVVMASTLGVFEDNLCISCAVSCGSYYGIWVMRNYNVKQSWEFLPNDYEMNSHDVVHYMKIYDCTSPKMKRMTFFCDDKPSLSRSGKHIEWAPIFVQSLVSPYNNSERPSHAGSTKVAERECQQMHKFESFGWSNYMRIEGVLRLIEEIYQLEGGENEKSYLVKERDCGILTREGCGSISLFSESGKNKRQRNK